MYDVVIFDLDGTLLDTLGDLAAAANYAIGTSGHAPRSIDEVRSFVGNGVKKLIERAIAPVSDEKVIEDTLAVFKKYYAEHINDRTEPYEGIIELLSRLNGAGVKVYINSNKFDSALKALCEAHFKGLYKMALGESPATPKKPDPTGALRLIELSGADKSKCVYIGDSESDMLTAKNAGIDAIWVSWGFRTREEMGSLLPDAVFDSPDVLGDYLLS